MNMQRFHFRQISIKENLGKLVGVAAAPATGGASLALGGMYDEGNKQANLAGQAAAKQEDRAYSLAGQVKTAAAPSFEELAAVQSLVTQREKTLTDQAAALGRTRQILETVDPLIKEQGKQALALLEGQDDARTSAARRSVDKKRMEYENRLADQLGPGWRTSSAGIQAMMAFEDQADNFMLNAQQQAFQNLQGLISMRPDEIGAINQAQAGALALNQTILGAENVMANRKADAVATGAPWLLGTADAQFAEQMAKSQNLSSLYGTTLAIGTQVAGAAFGGAMRPGGAMNPGGVTAAPTTLGQAGATGGGGGGFFTGSNPYDTGYSQGFTLGQLNGG